MANRTVAVYEEVVDRQIHPESRYCSAETVANGRTRTSVLVTVAAGSARIWLLAPFDSCRPVWQVFLKGVSVLVPGSLELSPPSRPVRTWRRAGPRLPPVASFSDR